MKPVAGLLARRFHLQRGRGGRACQSQACFARLGGPPSCGQRIRQLAHRHDAAVLRDQRGHGVAQRCHPAMLAPAIPCTPDGAGYLGRWGAKRFGDFPMGRQKTEAILDPQRRTDHSRLVFGNARGHELGGQ